MKHYLIILFLLILATPVFGANCGGGIQCHCGDTLTESQTMWYHLLDCAGDGLTITGNGITLDCANHTILGNGAGTDDFGIYFIDKSDITIKNCEIRYFYAGILMTNSFNNNIYDNIFASNYAMGISVYASPSNIITRNQFLFNQNWGVYITSASINNQFFLNNFTTNSITAYEENAATNKWNTSEYGNYWSDFSSNPGYPNTYIVPGPGNGIDYLPNVIETNDPPILSSIGNRSGFEGELLVIDVNATDPDNDTLTYFTNAEYVLPSPFTFDTSTGVFTWRPTAYDSGNYSVIFGASDGEFNDTEEIMITIEDVLFTTDFSITPDDIIFSNEYPLKQEPMTITAIFHNILEDDPEEVLVRFYNGTPSSETTIGEQLVIIRRSDFFAQIDWTPPIEGDLDIHVFVDPEDDIVEANETNNIAAKTLHVLTKPDIRIRDSDIAFTNNNPRTGDNITIMAMVRNIESLPTGEFTVRFYDNTWVNLIAEQTLNLNAFQTQLVQAWWIAPGGNHTVGVYGDSTFVVDELSETNNLGRKTILVRREPTGSSSPIFRKEHATQG